MGTVFERACDALKRYDAVSAGELERAWKKRPWVVVIAGDGADEVVAAVCGEKVSGAAMVRIQRGVRTQFRAVRADGRSEEHALASRGDDHDLLAARAADARDELAKHHVAIERVATAVPVIVRRKPQWWQFWLWPIYLVLRRLYRHRLVDVDAAVTAGDGARRVVEAAELELASADARARQARARYADSLRKLATTAGVRELVIEVADGPLAEGVELVVGERDDADVTLSPREAGVRLVQLAELASQAREAALARKAREAITAAAKAMDDKLTRAEDDFRARLAKLDAMAIGDIDGFVQAVTARLRPLIVSGVHAVLEQAQAHLGTELGKLQQEWTSSIAGASDGEDLSDVIERVDVSAPNVTQRVADEVRLLVNNGIDGVARDLYPQIVAAMKPHGLPEQHNRHIVVAAVELLPSLGGAEAKLGGTLKKLAGLFKGFDSKKSDARERAHERVDHLRDVANAELLDAEPRLHAVLASAIGGELTVLAGLQQQWLAGALDEERAAVTRERESLTQIAATRDAAYRDADSLAA